MSESEYFTCWVTFARKSNNRGWYALAVDDTAQGAQSNEIEREMVECSALEDLRAELAEQCRANGELQKALEAAQTAAIEKDALRISLNATLAVASRLTVDPENQVVYQLQALIDRFCPAPVKFEPEFLGKFLKKYDQGPFKGYICVGPTRIDCEMRDCGEYLEYWTTEPSK